MKISANAKINLSLDVLGTRPDGYHEVCMIMQSVDLHDTLEIKENSTSSIILTCDNNALPCDDTNLIVRAAKALMSEVGASDGIDINLSKVIPMAAGLAGGSADAAAALVGINKLMGYGLSVDRLKDIGAKLGADIPFCIQGGTCMAEGIGERLTPIASMPDCYIVLIKPPMDVSTKYVYDNLSTDTAPHPDVYGMKSFIENKDLNGISSSLGNILESVTVKKYPEISNITKRLKQLGANGALMSGSGPSVFGLFDDEAAANRAFAAMREEFALTDPDRDYMMFVCRPAGEGVFLYAD